MSKASPPRRVPRGFPHTLPALPSSIPSSVFGLIIFAPCLKLIAMGNSLYPCITSSSGGNKVKLIFWGGAVTHLPDAVPAGKLMFEHPDHVVCHADSFYVGQPVPVLDMEEELVVGGTYFVIPIDRLPSHTLTAASLSGLSAGPRGSTLDFGKCPFQYTKGANGRSLIKVTPEFISRIISDGKSNGEDGNSSGGVDGRNAGTLCSTPELQRHYSQLVTPREQQWSPKLETIREKGRATLSPSRLLGLDWR